MSAHRRALAEGEAGFATPAALVIALILALMVATLLARAVVEMRRAEVRLKQSQVASVLDGAQLIAALTIRNGAMHDAQTWLIKTDLGFVQVFAQPADNLWPLMAAGGGVSVDDLVRLTPKDPKIIRAKLLALSTEPLSIADGKIIDVDASPRWRACARNVFSAYGRKQEFTHSNRRNELSMPSGTANHDGEFWRIRIDTMDGWRDDRTVRLSRDDRRPVVIASRWFGRESAPSYGNGRVANPRRGDKECELIVRSPR